MISNSKEANGGIAAKIVIRYLVEDSVAQSIKWKKEIDVLLGCWHWNFKHVRSQIWKWKYDACNNLVDESEIDETIKQTIPYQGCNKSNNADGLNWYQLRVVLILHDTRLLQIKCCLWWISFSSSFFLFFIFFKKTLLMHKKIQLHSHTFLCAIYQISKIIFLEIFTSFPFFLSKCNRQRAYKL